MRWYSSLARKEPHDGELKEVTRFAWFPRTIDEVVVWLEPYTEVRRYWASNKRGTETREFGIFPGWQHERFETRSYW